MRPTCHFIRRLYPPIAKCQQRRNLLTLAIETSCDDTSVAVLEKHKNNSATLHFHSKITSDNREFGGISPIKSLHSHQEELAGLVSEALQSLPQQPAESATIGSTLLIKGKNGAELRRKPDFVTATRGPGMRSNLLTGLDTAKGLSVAWQIPFLGVNHMQAHALTPRLVSALDADNGGTANFNLERPNAPKFPYLSLLVSGGNTMLVHSKETCHHKILAETLDIAIGDLLDKTARDILPKEIIESATDVSYGALLETFALPDASETNDYDYTPPHADRRPRRESNVSSSASISLKARDWSITPPLSKGTGKRSPEHLGASLSFSGIGSRVKKIIENSPGGMEDYERRILARETMRVAFEHLAYRVIMGLRRTDVRRIKSVVVAGGVASNQYLKHILRAMLDVNGYTTISLVFPPPILCTDNAAMIGWTGIEMWEAGYRTDLNVRALPKWFIDPRAADGGILGADGWTLNGVKVAARDAAEDNGAPDVEDKKCEDENSEEQNDEDQKGGNESS